MFCLKCGQELPEGAEFCFKCGTSQAAAAPYMSSTNSERINLDGAHTFVPAMCPNCNAHLKVDSSSKIARCDTCGTECLVQDAIKALTVKGNVQVGNATINVNGANIDGLLRRAEIMLADGNFEGAKEKCDNILDVDPTNAKAYIIMLMAALRVNRQDDLANCRQPFDTNNFYLKAMQFGDEQTKAKLTGYINQINERNRYEYLKGIYDKAVLVMESATTESGYEYAIELLKLTPDFLDSNERIEECLRRIKELKTERIEQEKIQKEKRRIAEKKAGKLNKILIASILIIAIAVIIPTVIIPALRKNKAKKLLNSGDYDSAYTLLEQLGETEEIKASKYDRAIALINSGDYETAYILLEQLEGNEYKDSASKRMEIWLRGCPVGETVFFGSYEQDNIIDNGKEAIEWIVLERDNDKVLLISKYALDFEVYDKGGYSTWETCSLRKWLNDTFLKEAFSPDEQNKIIRTKVTNYNHLWEASGYTEDRVYIFSYPEAEKYMDSAEERQCEKTTYCYEHVSSNSNTKATSDWWLRGPSSYPAFGSYVYKNGEFYNGIGRADVEWTPYTVSQENEYHCVRPVIWLEIDS